MILNNMLALIEQIPRGFGNLATTEIYCGSIPFRCASQPDGVYLSANAVGAFNNINGNRTLTASLYLGTGTAEPTIDDYSGTMTASGDVTQIEVYKSGTSFNNYNKIITVSGTYINSTDSDITFTEIGYGIQIWITNSAYYASSNDNPPNAWASSPNTIGSSTNFLFCGTVSNGTPLFSRYNGTNNDFILLTRDLFETPVTVKAGQTYTFTYKIDFSKLATEAS